MIVASLSSDFIFFGPHLFLSLCNHPLLTANVLVSLVSQIPCWSFITGSVLFGTRHCGQWEHVFVHVLHPQIECLFHLHCILSTHCGHNFWSLGWTAKPAGISFSFFTMSRSTYNFFHSLLIQEHSPFHFKKALYHFSLEYHNC